MSTRLSKRWQPGDRIVTDTVASAPIAVRDLTVAFGETTALDRVSFRVEAGSMVGVLGPNGAGKSTLFEVLAGLQPFARGEVLIHGCPAARTSGALAYVPQKERINWRVPLSVMQVAMQGCIRRQQWLRPPRRADLEIGEEALRQVGLWSRREEPMASLSLGQQQRVFLARSLAQGADILLLDETFSGVDIRSKEALMKTLHELCDRGRTILLASHAVDQVEHNCDCCLCLNRGMVVFGRTRDLVASGIIRDLVGS